MPEVLIIKGENRGMFSKTKFKVFITSKEQVNILRTNLPGSFPYVPYRLWEEQPENNSIGECYISLRKSNYYEHFIDKIDKNKFAHITLTVIPSAEKIFYDNNYYNGVNLLLVDFDVQII